MPKLKTNKLISKRIKKTKTGKILKNSTGQGHFNSKDTGKQSRQKRKGKTFAKVENKTLNKLTPYS